MKEWGTGVTEVFGLRWAEREGEHTLAVGHRPHDARTGWLLLAASPRWSEDLPSRDTAQVAEFARALLDLPTDREPYDWETELSRTTMSEKGRTVHFATVTVATDPTTGCRPFLHYQSFYEVGSAVGLGFEVLCEDVHAEQLHAGARELLATLGVTS
jgi:hypothetical protein